VVRAGCAPAIRSGRAADREPLRQRFQGCERAAAAAIPGDRGAGPAARGASSRPEAKAKR